MLTNGNGAEAGHARLRVLADRALRRAARPARAEDRVDSLVRELICHACDVAHECGVPAERLLLVLKEAWWELPEARHLPRPDAGEVLARTITVCIHEYYARVAHTDDGQVAPQAG